MTKSVQKIIKITTLCGSNDFFGRIVPKRIGTTTPVSAECCQKRVKEEDNGGAKRLGPPTALKTNLSAVPAFSWDKRWKENGLQDRILRWPKEDWRPEWEPTDKDFPVVKICMNWTFSAKITMNFSNKLLADKVKKHLVWLLLFARPYESACIPPDPENCQMSKLLSRAHEADCRTLFQISPVRLKGLGAAWARLEHSKHPVKI